MAAHVATGKTVEEAIAQALLHLGCEREAVDVEVLETASSGFLGLFGGHPAKVRVTEKAPQTEKEARQEKEIHNLPVDAVEKPAQKSAAPAMANAAAAPKREAQKQGMALDEPQELTEAKKMAAESDRPWMPPEESGAIDTPYSEQRSYGVTATTPAQAAVKPFGGHTRREDEPREERRRQRRERTFTDRQHDVTPMQMDGGKTSASPAVPVTPDYEGVAESDLTPRQRAEKFLCACFQCMDLDVQMTLAETDEGVVYDLKGAGLGLLIGKHGQTLDALQYLTNLAANKGKDEERYRVILDVEGYRSRREETLKRLAQHLAEKACRIHAEVRLEPMNRHERKIIHMALQGSRRVSTYSDGDEPYRCVVIAPKKRRRSRPRKERMEETPVERAEEE